MARQNGNGIGTLGEKSLHASLKSWYERDGDLVEEKVDGYHIDIKRGPLLIEIQSKNFSAIKKKLSVLLLTHPILLAHPIASSKWILKFDKYGNLQGKRKSPKKGRVEDIFSELIRLPSLAIQSNLSFDILLVDVEEHWMDDGRGSWRRKKWSIQDRRLIKVNHKVHIDHHSEFLNFLPFEKSQSFKVKDLAKRLKIKQNLAGKMCYSLRKMKLLEIVGKEGNAHILERSM